MNATKRTFWYFVLTLLSGVNIVSANDSSRLKGINSIAVGKGSQAVAGGISISGNKVVGGEEAREMKTEEREVEGINNCNALKVENFSGEVVVHFGKNNTAVVSAEEKVVSVINITAQGKVLVISMKNSIATNTPIVVSLSIKNISSITVNGAADLFIKDISANKFKADIRDSASIIISGYTDEFTAIVKGSGDLKAGDLVTKRCDVTVNDSGDAEVNVTESLIAQASGAGDIVYHGKPAVVSKNVAEAGDIVSAEN